MAESTLYLLTKDSFDDLTIDDNEMPHRTHENIGYFEDEQLALKHYEKTTEPYKGIMRFSTKEIRLSSLYPEAFDGFDRCFVADETCGGDCSDYPSRFFITLLKLEGFSVVQDSYCTEFKDCPINGYNVPVATVGYEDGENGMPERVERIDVIREG